MIPHIIHYCWFGRNPLPASALKCIESWKRFFPDYEIREWNEDNFNVNIIPYTSEAYAAKKYAFVSDYARFWILYHYGGIYFDTDVEVIKGMNDIVSKGAFMGCEEDGERISVAPGLGIGAPKGMSLYNKLLDYYEDLHFDANHITQTIVAHTTNVLMELGLRKSLEIQEIASCTIYPSEYFNPMNMITKRIRKTQNTRSIHWYASSWCEANNNIFKNTLRQFIPECILLLWNHRKFRK